MERALKGIRVIELASYLAGPHAGMVLADLGADVIKIEQIEGDFTRKAAGGSINGESVFFLTCNRNKRGISVDLKKPAGRAIMHDLVKVSDVVLDNFRPGVMARLGLDYESLRAVDPRIVCCSVSGYGQNGPYRQRPAYDYLLQGWTGIAHAIGDEGGPPMTTRLSMVDLHTGMHAVVGILAALEARHRTGVGQFVDIALLDCAWSMYTYDLTTYLATREPLHRYKGSAHPYSVPAQIFQTADSYLTVIAPSDDFFSRLCSVLGIPGAGADPRFASPRLRARHRSELVAMIQEAFLKRTTAEWMADLIAADIPAAPINDLDAALRDPQIKARDGVVTVQHPVAGPVQMAGNPVKLSNSAPVFDPSPLLGQHTREVLSGLLGYSQERIERLAQEGVCRLNDHGKA